MKDHRSIGARWPWCISASFVLLFALGVLMLGPHFVFGEGHAERPIWTFLFCYTAGWFGFALAGVLLWRGVLPPMAVVIGVAILARGLMIDSNLVQSSDVYRYVFDGEAVLHGVNPYRHAPGEVAENASANFRPSLETDKAQRVLDRVSYPDVPTIYPPFAQVMFAAGAGLTPWNWFGQRIVFVLCDIATIVLLIALLKRFRMPPAWVAIYAWNPLVLKEIANAAHVDSLATVCLIAALFAAARSTDSPAIRWPMVCGLALAGAILAKLYPVLLVPAFVAYWIRQHGGFRSTAAFITVLTGCIIIAYIPFLSVGVDTLTEGFRRYAGEWRRNDGAFALVAALTSHARAVSLGLIGVGAIYGAFHILRRDASIDRLIGVIQYTLLGWLLLLPAPYPWYATSLIAVCVLRPRVWVIVISGALAVYYYSFIHEYRGHPDGWLYLSQAIEHGAIWMAVFASFAVGKKWVPRADAA
jgi:hypothetical protein